MLKFKKIPKADLIAMHEGFVKESHRNPKCEGCDYVGSDLVLVGKYKIDEMLILRCPVCVLRSKIEEHELAIHQLEMEIKILEEACNEG